ncbi:unnamed protein product [Adineta steineri]|uniref:MD-2-related lipid-recognition domain-containing protein n=1 Tax=Adineta steineri TaxID=433720 RepID=A0A814GWP0_9BILA|nr:unnamed protein product [Adineta steineri]CAF3734190.1 unnamed protein product [Adineta steineri]
MTGVSMIFYLYLFFLQLTLVVAEISWDNCASDTNTMKLVDLEIDPYPVVTPGTISVKITIHNDKPISSPLKAELSLHKKLLFGSIPIPCVSGIGSCKFDDLCSLCSQCCPLTAGDHVITLPITIDTTSWALAGNYHAQVDIETSSEEKGCVKLNNIQIKSSK